MKKIMTVLTCGLVLASFANCGKNDDGPKGGAAEMSGACFQSFQMQRQSTNQWGQAQQQPFGGSCNYPYAQAANAGFTSVNGGLTYTSGGLWGSGGGMACSGSQSQVYSPSKGVGCVDNTRITMSGQPVLFDQNPANGNFTQISQPNPYFAYQNQGGMQGYPNQGYPNQPGMTNTSYLPATITQVLRVCDGAEVCAAGQTCRSPYGPMAGPVAPIGLCYFN